MRKKYIDRIVNWVLHLTSYPGEWCKGYHHEYDIAIRNIFTDNRFVTGLVVDNGDLSLEVWSFDEAGVRSIAYVQQYELSTYQLWKIYRILKSINLFKP